ncbi:MAG: hydrogenase maturation protease [Gemmataceae bacterium]|nr:hydrogenase maturation protease [Planctomycetia bacterium]MBX3399418.1 hydrogenase maturation protease [Gemmataceae bacterium]
MSVLLVGIGNTLRRDDGAGASVVERFVGRADCHVLVVHQLLPEHVDELTRCDRVVFVDAAINTDRVRFERLTPSRSPPSLGHAGDPGWHLAFCESLHGYSPEAWLLTIPATDLGFGDGLSLAAEEAVEEAVRLLEAHITK